MDLSNLVAERTQVQRTQDHLPLGYRLAVLGLIVATVVITVALLVLKPGAPESQPLPGWWPSQPLPDDTGNILAPELPNEQQIGYLRGRRVVITSGAGR